MTQRNRTKIEVETLEDRVTPAAFTWPSQLCALKSTLQAKISTLPSSFSAQLASLRTKIHSLNGSHGTLSCTTNGNSHVHSRICSLLDAAYAKLVSIGAPQSA